MSTVFIVYTRGSVRVQGPVSGKEKGQVVNPPLLSISVKKFIGVRRPRPYVLLDLQQIIGGFHPQEIAVGEVVEQHPGIIHAAAGEPARAHR